MGRADGGLRLQRLCPKGRQARWRSEMRERDLQIEGECICQSLATEVQHFLRRPLEFSHYHYFYLDATYLHGRDGVGKQVISRAVIVAVGIKAPGQREV